MRALDDTDHKIIRALQENARLSNKELAARVHLSPSSCLERARRLKDSGVLTAFNARIEPSAIGVSLQAMISAKLHGHSRENRETFRQQALRCEEVVALYHVTGARDFILHVAVRDAEHLRRLIVDELSASIELEQIETSLILQEESRPLPILFGTSETTAGHANPIGSKTLAFKTHLG